MRAVRNEERGEHDDDHAEHRKDGQRNLNFHAGRRTEYVQCGQASDGACRVNRGTVLSERENLRGVIPEHERDCGDGAGLNDGAARPPEQHGNRTAEAAHEEMVLATCVGVGRCKFGITKRADQGYETAEQPRADKRGLAADIHGNQRRGLEDADADDNADHYGNAIQHRQAGTRRRSLTIVHVASSDVAFRSPAPAFIVRAVWYFVE